MIFRWQEAEIVSEEPERWPRSNNSLYDEHITARPNQDLKIGRSNAIFGLGETEMFSDYLECVVCGAEIHISENQKQNPVCSSELCRKEFAKRRNEESAILSNGIPRCQHCGKVLYQSRKSQKYCGIVCANKTYRKRKRFKRIHQVHGKHVENTCRMCGRPISKTKRFCSEKCRGEHQAITGYWKKANPDEYPEAKNLL
jgi:predicted nucleic acid-binding Zn ribbon protein